MNKVLIIGCGGVGTVAAYKCAQYPEVFHEIVIASRRKEKCDEVAKAIGAPNITTDQVDADEAPTSTGGELGSPLPRPHHYGRLLGMWCELPRHRQL